MRKHRNNSASDAPERRYSQVSHHMAGRSAVEMAQINHLPPDWVMAQLSTPENFRGQAIRIRETLRELLANDSPAEMRETLQDRIAASREQPWLQTGGTLSD